MTRCNNQQVATTSKDAEIKWIYSCPKLLALLLVRERERKSKRQTFFFYSFSLHNFYGINLLNCARSVYIKLIDKHFEQDFESYISFDLENCINNVWRYTVIVMARYHHKVCCQRCASNVSLKRKGVRVTGISLIKSNKLYCCRNFFFSSTPSFPLLVMRCNTLKMNVAMYMSLYGDGVRCKLAHEFRSTWNIFSLKF